MPKKMVKIEQKLEQRGKFPFGQSPPKFCSTFWKKTRVAPPAKKSNHFENTHASTGDQNKSHAIFLFRAFVFFSPSHGST